MGEYKVHNVYWKAGSINIQILEVPQEDVEDKLVPLSDCKGIVNKIQYEDFLISTCLLNPSQVVQIIFGREVFEDDLMSLRKDLIRIILDVNPHLRPENLVINDNNVIKSTMLGNEVKGRPLMSNSAWASKKDQDAYLNSLMAPMMLFDMGTPGMSPGRIMEEMFQSPKRQTPNPKDKKTIWWDRMSMHVVINVFDKNDMVSLIGGKTYKTKISYMSYLVKKGIDDVDKLIKMCDQTGLSKRIPEEVIVEELYGLVVKKNSFLKYEDIDFEEINKEFEEEQFEPAEPVGFMNPQMGGPIPPGRPGPMFLQRSVREKSKVKKKSFEKVEKKKLLSLDKDIKKRIVGQDEAVDLIVDSIQRAAAGLRRDDHPIGSFIFTGETGIGKTETAKVLAEELIGERAGLITIDCSEYTQDHEYAKLIGSPPGYIGYDDGGVLTNALMTQPFRIILFDEFDKASKKMYDLMLQVLDEGRLTDGKGKKVSFRDAIVIFTANLGVREIEKARKPLGFQQNPTFTEEKKRKALETALKKTFRPEFLNRIDNIAHFRTLNKENYMSIVDLLFKDVQKLLDKKKIKLKVATSIKEHIYKEGVDPKYGARPLERAIKKIVSTPLARKIIEDDVKDGASVSVKNEKGKVKFKITNPKKKEKKDEKVD